MGKASKRNEIGFTWKFFEAIVGFMKETTLGDVKVMYVIAENMGNVGKAFQELEARLPSIKGRRFYGTYYDGVYKACVAIREGDDPARLGLNTDTIPGGKYISEKMNDWESHIPEIKERFLEMARENNVDNDRPSIEYYRSGRELILYLPIN
jgi:hypothetical protein